jgi:glycosyltransferase involved in cell wall biosynthesis
MDEFHKISSTWTRAPSLEVSHQVSPRRQSTGYATVGTRLVSYTIQDFRAEAHQKEILAVIPAFNADRWITQCLLSLSNNREPHDVLIVDDGSDNPVSHIVLPMENLVIIRLFQNCGIVAALNIAAIFSLEQGYKYYARQDADDISYPERLRTQRSLSEATGAILVTSLARFVDEAGKTLWISKDIIPPERVRNCLAKRNLYVHSSWFLRTTAFLLAGLYSREYQGAEDYELLHRLCRAGHIVTADLPLIDYLVHSASILSRNKTASRAQIRVQLRYFNFRRLSSYIGLLRSCSACLIPRSWKTRSRKLAQRFLRLGLPPSASPPFGNAESDDM